jgi:restriction endonuclease S subunit
LLNVPIENLGYKRHFSILKQKRIPIPPIKIQQKIVERLDVIRKVQELNNLQITKTEELFESISTLILKSDKKYKLGELYERKSESILPKIHPEKKYAFIGLENIESNMGRLTNFSSKKGKEILSIKFLFEKEDVLYGKLRPYLNKVWCAEFDGICSTDIWVLKPKPSIIFPLILVTLLRSKIIVNKMTNLMVGANLPRVNSEMFDRIEVSVPNLEKQKQIVEKLSAVQEYKKQLLEQKAKLKELFDSVLAKSFSEEFKNAED